MYKKRIIRFSLCLVGFGCVLSGILQGDFSSTWNKAIRICLECIGIG